MEEDVRLETLFVPIAIGLFDETLDLIVEALNGTIGLAMHKERQDITQVGLAHPSHLFDGRQAAANGPSIPFPEIPLGWLGPGA